MCDIDRSSKLSWKEKRISLPRVFYDNDSFTDIELHVGRKIFRAHKIILASHCEYFARLLQSGMKEAGEGAITFHELNADILSLVLHYIYTGELPRALGFDRQKELLMLANMWQMEDLEIVLLERLIKLCSPQHCLKIFLFLKDVGDLFHDKEKVLKEYVESMLIDTIRDRWHIILSGKGNEDLEQDFDTVKLVDLELPQLIEILELKSEQEDIGDFSFSFNQSDLCQAVVQWIRADLEARQEHLETLSRFFCLHQVNGSSSLGLNLLYKDLKLLHHRDQNFPSEPCLEKCIGVWCPQRKISGLLIAHAWSPASNNRITCDHIFFYFTVPKALASESTTPLKSDTFYDVGQFGDLGDGEKHCLIPNNCVYLRPIEAYLLLTVDGGSLSGTVVDPLQSGFACAYHHSPMFRFCSSNVLECVCDFERVSVCSPGAQGKVYIVTCPVCQKSETSYKPCCDTFVAVDPPDLPNAGSLGVFGQMCVAHEDEKIFAFGGHILEPGELFAYVHCSYDLQEFSSNYKSGHAHIRTRIGYLKDTPIPKLVCQVLELSTGVWSEYPAMKMPGQIGDAASIIYDNKIWLVGGYVIDYDHSLKVFFQRPQNSVWTYDLSLDRWERLEDIPGEGGITKATLHYYQSSLYLSGGACLKINTASESNQIYEYIPNRRVFKLDKEKDRYSWSTLLDLGKFSEGLKDDTYSVLAVVPVEVSLKRLKVKKEQMGAKFAVKFLNTRHHYHNTKRKTKNKAAAVV